MQSLAWRLRAPCSAFGLCCTCIDPSISITPTCIATSPARSRWQRSASSRLFLIGTTQVEVPFSSICRSAHLVWFAAGRPQASSKRCSPALKLCSFTLLPNAFFRGRSHWLPPLFFTLHYLAIGYAGFFLSENYLAFAVIAACALFTPRKARYLFAAGVMIGLGAWAKSQCIVLAPLWSLALWQQRKRLGALVLMLGGLAVVVSVSLYVSLVNHQPTFISYNGGQTFALSHCRIRDIAYSNPVTHSAMSFGLPVAWQRIERGEVEASWPHGRYQTPFVDSSFYLHEGLRCIKTEPQHFLRMVFYHVADTFTGPPWSLTVPWPDSHTAFRRWAFFSNLLVCWVAFPLALVGFYARRRNLGVWVLFALPLASVLATAVLFHGDPRFRAPYDFGIFIAASAGVEALLGTICRRSR